MIQNQGSRIPVFLFVGLVSTIALLALAIIEPAGSDTYLLPLVLFGAVIVTATISLKNEPLLTVAKWVLAYITLTTLVRAIFLIATSSNEVPIIQHLGRGELFERVLTNALWLGVASLIAFILGHSAIRRSRSTAHERPFATSPKGAIGASGWVCAAAVASTIAVPGSRVSDVTAGGDFVFSLPAYFATGWGVLLVYFAFAGDKRAKTFILPFVFLALMRVLLIGSKAMLLALVLTGFICAVARLPRNRRALLIPIAAGLLPLALGTFSVASSGTVSSVSSSVTDGSSALVSRSYGVDSVMATQVYLEDGAPYGGLESLDLAFTGVIPRALWPDKPKSFSQRFGVQVFWFSSLAGVSFFAPSLTGELLLSGGIVAVVLGWLLFGVITGLADKRLSPAWRILILLLLIKMVEGSVVSQIYSAIPAILAGLFLISPNDSGSLECPTRAGMRASAIQGRS